MTAWLAGKTALVTGASTGIGLAVATRFVQEGAHVFITGRRQGPLDDAAATLGDQVTAVRADAASPDDLDELFGQITARGQGLDAVHVNAGGGTYKPLSEVTPDDIDQAFAANVRGAILTVQKAVPLMRAGGSVVLTGSTQADGGQAAFGLYSASKAALRTLTRTWAVELAPKGIRVNDVTPGPTETPGLAGLAPENSAELLRALAASVPLGRLITPEEVASAVLFLVSDMSSATTGSELFVDGGDAHS
ncbi:SDR family NAD(P)-dependent oxidoreductase [Curtobacterium sp. ISL-83]|uniref:SDR family NAD(P)-dependent oxidoreductase n=1 Tax=Curtobacterium sp. ISL-83 TaxID=2819145 RepID=UPI001BE5AC2E|nr:SDR family oxidoreductase [Curtobacterium sp. ISL-83]MBT2502845.1 SDR family oxidoreductase [Curtobacterium sp. ISL-83]